MNIQQAKNSSKAFYLAAQRCEEQRPLGLSQFQMLTVPAVVCLAFSIEVGLKALILQSGKQPSGGHDLADLFGQIPVGNREEIVRGSGLNAVAFDERLLASATLFVTWRYIYERDSASADLEFVHGLAASVQTQLDKTL